MTDTEWYDDVVVPALLRAARNAYATSIRGCLADGGFSDIPRNGSYVLGALARSTPDEGPSLTALSEQLAVSKQAASQLIDTLVLRGYLDRRPDPEDRRRMTVQLTERGQAAAEAVRDGVEAVDRELADRVGGDGVRSLRAGLGALAGIGMHDSHAAVDH